jgi:enoyl-CoA hydratase/carnithine racemase
MKFHLPSFLIGWASGAGTALLAPRLRKLAMELATTGYRVADGVAVRLARKREDFEDLLAEAKARARTAADERRAS